MKINHLVAICSVDYPSLNLRLAKMLFDHKLSQKAGGGRKVFYYMSPHVWTWKPKRSHRMAKFVEQMAIILLF
jgi:lipid-A-disaccharide synthase